VSFSGISEVEIKDKPQSQPQPQQDGQVSFLLSPRHSLNPLTPEEQEDKTERIMKRRPTHLVKKINDNEEGQNQNTSFSPNKAHKGKYSRKGVYRSHYRISIPTKEHSACDTTGLYASDTKNNYACGMKDYYASDTVLLAHPKVYLRRTSLTEADTYKSEVYQLSRQTDDSFFERALDLFTGRQTPKLQPHKCRFFMVKVDPSGKAHKYDLA
jgi:hypothetical protein